MLVKLYIKLKLNRKKLMSFKFKFLELNKKDI